MKTSFAPTDMHTEAFGGIQRQVEMPIVGAVRDAQALDEFVVTRATFNGCLNEAVRHSGMDDQQIATKIHISQSYMSRFMRGIGAQWAKRIVLFMQVTQSIAPLQWIALQVGCEVTITNAVVRERNALRARLAQLDGKEFA